jgi:hypothetical protein
VQLLHKSARMKLLMWKTIGGCCVVMGRHQRADLIWNDVWNRWREIWRELLFYLWPQFGPSHLWPQFGPTDSLKGKWAKVGPQVAGPQEAILFYSPVIQNTSCDSLFALLFSFILLLLFVGVHVFKPF